MQVSFSVAEIAALVQPIRASGSTVETIHGIAALADAGPGDISFLGNAKYRGEVSKTRASVVLLPGISRASRRRASFS